MAQQEVNAESTGGLVAVLDNGLKAYYEHLNREYDSLFADWCEESMYVPFRSE